MRIVPPEQTFWIPISLLCSALALYPALHHYNVKVLSPTAVTRGEVEQWAEAEARNQQCLNWSIDLDIESEGGGWPTAKSGPWFATLRCHKQRVYYRLAIVLFAPWVAFNLVIMLVNLLAPPTSRKHG